MLVNWKIQYCTEVPENKQPPDYYVKGSSYWFYRYFENDVEVDVIDISSFPWIENFEKKYLHFYVVQAIKAIPKLNRYDLVVSHGMQSAVIICLWKRLFKTKIKHIVFDIGCFNSAAKEGRILKLMQFVSKSLDGLIYHTSSQLEYYKEFFPWLLGRVKYIRFGTDFDFFDTQNTKMVEDFEKYILCIGYDRCDWDTVIKAHKLVDTDIQLRFIGHIDEKYKNKKNVQQFSRININELIEQIRGALFCILPLNYVEYSFGQMRLLQQMALGKCVIASRVPSLVDYIQENKNAVLYEPEDEKDLCVKIKDLLTHSDKVKEIGKQAKEFVATQCDERKMAIEIEKAYKEFMEKVL